ncbi:TonB-dependent receptor [hydrothermal vent metagenome]|uniref:TonB-dependent receptor n=1 Tax=hydrothermal vent metagenome TaxID=652676 RepID=A0A3B0RUU5_9ZZZZ
MYITPFHNTFNVKRMTTWAALLCSTALLAVTPYAHAEEAAEALEADDIALEEVVVTGKPVTYANNATDKVMLDQTAPAASVLSAIDNLPGIFISEGGTFGSDDWSTTISIRGFNVGLSEQQIGMTIDGLPNGNSNYGGGSKANRYIDSENMARAEVSQGTSDIASPSHEALGGTINFVTNNPTEESGMRAGISVGNNNAQRYFFRYDTGEIMQNTRAYISYSHTYNDAWIGNEGNTERDHISAKFVTELENWTLTGRFSWDDAAEDNYQRISIDQFIQNPDWDRLTDTITGIPYVDQAYRPSWSTLRTNYFTYLRAAYEGDGFKAEISPYFHSQNGRGDWVPPYLVNVNGGTTTRPSGSRSLDSGPNTLFGGSFDSTYTYVDAAGTQLSPFDNCTARLTFPYGGGGAANNPACFPVGSNPVGSYRHTHYNKKRIGVTADASAEIGENNTVRAGLWWERADRDEGRDWHKIIDPRSSQEFDNAAYWRQYERNFITNTFMVYAEDTLEIGDLVLNGGLRKFIVSLTRTDTFGIENQFKKDSNSKILFTAGALYNATEDLEVFAGFSQNFAAIKDSVIEKGPSSVGANLDGETADNFDIGFRYGNDWLQANITAYYIKFNNRIVSIPIGDSVNGIDFINQNQNVFENVGGVESKGLEASVSADVTDHWNIYSSLTINDSVYTQTVSNVVKDNKVALSPEFLMVGTLSYANDGMRGGVSAKHVGKRWGNFDNTDRLASYTVVDMWVGYSMEMAGINNIDLSLNVNNLTDKRYLGGGTPGGYFIGSGRQVMATVTVGF